jgi:hypothetical protein
MLSAEFSCHSSKCSSAAIKIAASECAAYSANAVECWYRACSRISANTATANFALFKNAANDPNKSAFEVLPLINHYSRLIMCMLALTAILKMSAYEFFCYHYHKDKCLWSILATQCSFLYVW